MLVYQGALVIITKNESSAKSLNLSTPDETLSRLVVLDETFPESISVEKDHE
jgi:hypothetical protein